MSVSIARDRVLVIARPASSARALELAFAFGALFFFTDAIRVLLQNPGGVDVVTVAGDPYTLPVLILIHAVSVALLLMRGRSTVAALRQSIGCWAFTLFAVISALWSTDRTVSAKAGVWLIATGLFATYFALSFTPSEQLRLIGAVLGIAAVLSLLVGLLNPSLGSEPGAADHAWRGIFIQKNVLGRAMALSCIVFAMLARRSRRWTVIMWSMAGISMVLVILSRSATSLISVAALVALMPARRLLISKRFRLSSALLIASALVAALLAAVLVFWEPLLGMLGRDSSLTGRTALWAVIVEMIARHPWFGYGNQAFWHGRAGDYLTVWKIVGWNPPHAHNGFLDLALDVGILGVAGFVVLASSLLIKAIASSRTDDRSLGPCWALAYLTFFLVSNVTESTILRHNSIFWVLFMSLPVLLTRRDDKASDV